MNQGLGELELYQPHDGNDVTKDEVLEAVAQLLDGKHSAITITAPLEPSGYWTIIGEDTGEVLEVRSA